MESSPDISGSCAQNETNLKTKKHTKRVLALRGSEVNAFRLV